MALKKSNKSKKLAPKQVAKQLFYYYLVRGGIKATDLAEYASLPEENTEVWVELNLLELILTNDSLVLEDACEEFEAEEDQELLKKYNVEQVYAVTFDERDSNEALKILEKFVIRAGGMICSDTEDLQPIIMGE